MSSKYLNISIYKDLLDIFLPNLCLLCDRPLENQNPYVCPLCWASLRVFPDRTGAPFRSLRGALDRLWIGWDYDESMRRVVHFFKFESRPELARRLIQEWLKVVPHEDELRQVDTLLPVPIHAARRRWRGFNQSELLALALGKILNRPVADRQAVRVINTPSQTSLDRQKRFRSVARAFEIRQAESLQGRSILIVDDLATSGATILALAQLLKSCGVQSVSAAVLTSPALADS